MEHSLAAWLHQRSHALKACAASMSSLLVTAGRAKLPALMHLRNVAHTLQLASRMLADLGHSVTCMQVTPREVQLPAQLRLRNVAHVVRRSYTNLARLVGRSPSPHSSPEPSSRVRDSAAAANGHDLPVSIPEQLSRGVQSTSAPL